MRRTLEGIFTIDVPEGWQVHEEGSLIEIVPPIGAAHVSVLRGARDGDVAAGEAAILAYDFARRQGVSLLRALETREHRHSSAIVSFQTADNRGPVEWHVETHVWDNGALICSYTHDGRHEDTKAAALRMFASIQPV